MFHNGEDNSLTFNTYDKFPMGDLLKSDKVPSIGEAENKDVWYLQILCSKTYVLRYTVSMLEV